MSIFNTKTSTEEAGITPTLLDAITDAYNRNDIDAVMSFFAKDAVFDHASGPDINGTRFEGLETIRGIFQGLFNNVESVQWTPIDTRISGDKALRNAINLGMANYLVGTRCRINLVFS